MEKIDIERLDLLHRRQKTGQETVQCVFGMLSSGVLIAFGGRTLLALLIALVVLSLLMLRGYRWAGVTLYVLAFATLLAVSALLGYDAFWRRRPADQPLTESFDRLARLWFYAATAGSVAAGWFLVRGLLATLERSRLLPPLPVELTETARVWLGAAGRLLVRWQAWLLLIMMLAAGVVLNPLLFLFYFDLAVYGQPKFSNSFDVRPPFLVDWLVQVPWWAALLFMAAFVSGLAWLLVTAWGLFRRHLAETSAEARRRDPRPPVLLLRSFADDQVTVWPGQGLFLSAAVNTMERTLERVLRSVGPVIAIGRPGEALPPLGAAREYLPGETWRARVRELIRQAQRVVVVMGESEGLVYEYELLAGHDALDKVLLIIPPDQVEALASRWERFARHALADLPAESPDLQTAIVVLFPDGRTPVSVGHPRRRAKADQYALALQAALHRSGGATTVAP